MADEGIEHAVRAGVARMEELLSGPAPGGVWCAACRGPVSNRQRSATLRGRSLWAGPGKPGLDLPAQTYHLGRRSCWVEAAQHERRLLDADPDLPRQVTCPGTAYQHGDGQRECTAADQCTGQHAPPDRWGRVGMDCTTRVIADGGELPPPQGVCPAPGCRGRG